MLSKGYDWTVISLSGTGQDASDRRSDERFDWDVEYLGEMYEDCEILDNAWDPGYRVDKRQRTGFSGMARCLLGWIRGRLG